MSDAFRSDVEAQRARADALEAEVSALRAENAALRSGGPQAATKRDAAASRLPRRARVALAVAGGAFVFGAGGAMVLLGRSAGDRRGASSEKVSYALEFREAHRSVEALRGVSARDGTVLVVGEGGLIARSRDDAPFVRETTAIGYALHGVTLDGDSYAVGEHGTILRFDADRRAWLQETSGTDVTLYAVAAAPAEPVIAVGAAGTVLIRSERGEWRQVPKDGDEALYAVAATGGRAPYTAVGERGVILGAHVAYGERPHLTRQLVDARSSFRAVTVFGSDVWVGGDAGRLYRASAPGATPWASEPATAGASLRALCAVDVMVAERSPSSSTVGARSTLLGLGEGAQVMHTARRELGSWKPLPHSRVTPPTDVVAAHCAGGEGVLLTEHAVFRTALPPSR